MEEGKTVYNINIGRGQGNAADCTAGQRHKDGEDGAWRADLTENTASRNVKNTRQKIKTQIRHTEVKTMQIKPFII